MTHKTIRAWCLVYKGEIWPTYCGMNRNHVKTDAVNNLGQAKSWHGLEALGFRVRRVEIKVLV